MTARILFSLVVLAAGAGAQTLFMIDPMNDRLFTVDPATGAVTTASITTPIDSPQGLTSDGINLYTLDAGTSAGPNPAVHGLWALNLANGTPGLVAPEPPGLGLVFWEDLAWDSQASSFLGISNGIFLGNALYRIDYLGGATALHTYPIASGPVSLAIDAAGTVWVTTLVLSQPDTTLGTLDLTSGVITPVAQLPINAYSALTFHPSSGLLYIADPASQALLTFDPATSTLATIAALAEPTLPSLSPTGLRFASLAGPPASLLAVGTGCSGSNGVPLLLSPGGPPVIGDAGFALRVDNAAPSQGTYWFLADGAQLDAIPIEPGCAVHLEPTSLIATISTGLNPFFVVAASGQGTALLPAPLPPNPFLAGLTLGVQVYVVDPQVPRGFALTNAVELRLGF